MGKSAKTTQLQIRVSPAEKAAIVHAARRAGQDMSSYVLARVLNPASGRFQILVRECVGLVLSEARYELASLNDFLTSLSTVDLVEVVGTEPRARLTPEVANVVAAMVEMACERSAAPVPSWVGEVAPLEAPVFGSVLESLRLYLLTHALPSFRRRNLFFDSSLGDRV